MSSEYTPGNPRLGILRKHISPNQRKQDVYPGSKFFRSWIPDQGSKRFQDPGSGPASAFKNLSFLTQKMDQNVTKSRILDPDPQH
jgi:hypothetical protein